MRVPQEHVCIERLGDKALSISEAPEEGSLSSSSGLVASIPHFVFVQLAGHDAVRRSAIPLRHARYTSYGKPLPPGLSSRVGQWLFHARDVSTRSHRQHLNDPFESHGDKQRSAMGTSCSNRLRACGVTPMSSVAAHSCHERAASGRKTRLPTTGPAENCACRRRRKTPARLPALRRRPPVRPAAHAVGSRAFLPRHLFACQQFTPTDDPVPTNHAYRRLRAINPARAPTCAPPPHTARPRLASNRAKPRVRGLSTPKGAPLSQLADAALDPGNEVDRRLAARLAQRVTLPPHQLRAHVAGLGAVA